MTNTNANQTSEREEHLSLTMIAELSFLRLLRSEQIKLFSLRSTWWALAIIIVAQLAVGWAMATTVPTDSGSTPAATGGAEVGVQVATFGIVLTQLIAAVLGVIATTGEYSTGMIRSTLTAAPGRLSTLLAKSLVVGLTLFVSGVAGAALTAAVTAPILAPAGLAIDTSAVVPLVLSGLYLAFLAILSLSIGFLLRNSAGAVGTSLALILVLPVAVAVVPGNIARIIADALPSTAGQSMYTSGSTLEPWQGFLILLAWVIAGLVAAGFVLRRRDA